MIKYEISERNATLEAKGSTEVLLQEVAYLIAIVHKNITNKPNRMMFRACLTEAINSENSPIWETEEGGAAKIVGIDMEGLKNSWRS